MKILCTMEPWGWLIVNGHKDIENRVWQTKYRGELYISTTKKPYDNLDEMIEFAEAEYGIKVAKHELRHGGIIGKVDLVDVVDRSKRHKSKWHQDGYYGLVLRNARRVEFLPISSGRMIFNMTGLNIKEVK